MSSATQPLTIGRHTVGQAGPSLALLALALVLVASPPNMGLRSTAVVILGVTICILFAIGRTRGTWNPTFLCATVLSAFHFGALPQVLLDPDSFSGAGHFLLPRAGTKALWTSMAALLGFTAGLMTRAGQSPPQTASAPLSLESRLLGRTAGITCTGLIFTWFVVIVGGYGINPLTVPYLTILEVAGSSSWIYQPLGLAFVLTAMAPTDRMYKVWVMAFTLWAVVAFLAGFRGEVLFPLIAHAGTRSLTAPMPSGGKTLLGALSALAAASGVKSARAFGAAEYSWSAKELSPFSALEELGFTQHVVERVYEWHQMDGEPLRLGVTYIEPFARAVNRVFGIEVLPVHPDYIGLMNVETEQRLGQVGGSVIAEGIHNFGAVGAIAVLFFMGAVLALATTRVQSPRGLAVAGLIAFAFLWHVRNSFVPIPMMLVAGGILIVAFTSSKRTA